MGRLLWISFPFVFAAFRIKVRKGLLTDMANLGSSTGTLPEVFTLNGSAFILERGGLENAM